MKRTTMAIGISLIAACAASGQGIQIAPAGSLSAQVGAAENFSGYVAVDPKAVGDSSKLGSVGLVKFAVGARTAWHTHPAGQLLIVTEGSGWVQESGSPKRSIKAGDVVWINAGVKHWHGASATSSMSHLAVAYVREGKSADWKELVSDEQYNAP